jgi:hypothetical protein
MPWSHDPKVQALRLKYNAALAAHQACARALMEAALAGISPSGSAVEKEVEARAELDRAREALYAAMASIVAPVPAGAPPPEK